MLYPKGEVTFLLHLMSSTKNINSNINPRLFNSIITKPFL